MSVLLEVVFELILGLLEVWLGDLSWPGTKASRIFWAIVLLLVGGVIWWELR